MKIMDNMLRANPFNASLRVKITLVFIVPVILTMSLLSYLHIQGEREELQALVEANAIQLADVTLASLTHAMMENDREMEHTQLQDISSYPLIENIRVVSTNMQIRISTDASEAGKKYDLSQSGCVECHQFSPADRPRSMRLDLDSATLRVVTVIDNQPKCWACHSPEQNHLGVLLVDSSLERTEQSLRENTISSIGISVISILVVMAFSFLLVQWLVVRRVEVIRAALINFGRQDFSTRITKKWRTSDELTQLGDYFNQIASDLETLQSQKKERERVRALSIIEERGRIARELHDGVAQFLAYLSAKVGAIRVELRNQNIESADKNLQQIEQSIQGQSIEVRSSILGLKMAGEVDKGLLLNVTEFVEQCNRLDDLMIELEFVGDLSRVKLDSEKELQWMRILQEAVNNIRKHARASEASVRMEVASAQLRMTIADNGIGFDVLQTGMERVGHFGLQIIFERAHEIGAQIKIESAPREGTKVIVTMNLSESEDENLDRG